MKRKTCKCGHTKTDHKTTNSSGKKSHDGNCEWYDCPCQLFEIKIDDIIQEQPIEPKYLCLNAKQKRIYTIGNLKSDGTPHRK